MTNIVPIVMDIGSELPQFVPVLLELGFIGLNLGLAGAARFVCGKLLLVLPDLLLGCMHLLLVLFDILLISLNILLERVWIRRCARRCCCTSLGEGCRAERQGRCQNQVKSIVHSCLAPPRDEFPHTSQIKPELQGKLRESAMCLNSVGPNVNDLFSGSTCSRSWPLFASW